MPFAALIKREETVLLLFVLFKGLTFKEKKYRHEYQLGYWLKKEQSILIVYYCLVHFNSLK